MLGAHLSVRTFSSFRAFTDQANAAPPISSSLRSSSSSSCSPIRLNCGVRRRSSPDSFVVVCCSASGSPGIPSSRGHSDFLEAFLLVPEMISHYRMLRRGSSEEVKWQSTGKMPLLSVGEREPMTKFTTLGKGLLSRFQGPTIFLKVSCDGEFLLPIIVADNDILIVDARPSDAINVATRCKAPIYINKNIILTDAIRIGYDMGRGRHGRSTYDVLLDSAADGPDLLTEELTLLCNMNLAIKEERYTDAAMWRDRLMELRDSRSDS